MVEDVKGLTAGISRKRGKRRYFWEYSEQLTPSKQERMLKPSEWDRDTLPSNMYQKNGLHHGETKNALNYTFKLANTCGFDKSSKMVKNSVRKTLQLFLS